MMNSNALTAKDFKKKDLEKVKGAIPSLLI
jgi:hypothetical protein